MELLLRAIQQAILDENYLHAAQLIQQQIFFSPINDQTVLAFAVIEGTQDAQQLYNQAAFSLEQHNHEQAFNLFCVVISIILNTADNEDRQRIVEPIFTSTITESNISRRSTKRGRSDNSKDVPLAKNFFRDSFREESPEPLPPGPQVSPLSPGSQVFLS